MGIESKSRHINCGIKAKHLYFVAYILLLLRAFIYTTAFKDIIPWIIFFFLRYAAYGILITKFCIKRTIRIRKRVFFISAIILCVSILSYFMSTYWALVDYALCCICARDVEFEDIVKIYTKVSFGLIIITILSSLIGIIPNYIYYRSDTLVIRMSLGFIYPTDFAAHIFFLMLGFMYLNYYKLNWMYGVLYGLVAFGIYSVTDARGPSAMIVILFVVCYGYKFLSRKGLKVFPTWVLEYSSVFCAVITWVGIVLYDAGSNIWQAINAFSTKRLSYAVNIMEQNRVTLLGQYILQQGDGDGGRAAGVAYTYIDLSFQRILLMYGLVFFILLLVYSVLLNKKYIKAKKFVFPVLMFVVSFYSLTAQHYFDFAYDFLLLAYFTRDSKVVIVESDKHFVAHKKIKIKLRR